MKVFGPPWDAPIYDDAVADGEVVEVPVGQPCLFCETPIAEGDNGVMMAAVDKGGWKMVPLHKECNLRMVVGSIAHLEHRCPCYGGHDGDPVGVSKREAAKLVWNFWLARGRLDN